MHRSLNIRFSKDVVVVIAFNKNVILFVKFSKKIICFHCYCFSIM